MASHTPPPPDLDKLLELLEEAAKNLGIDIEENPKNDMEYNKELSEEVGLNSQELLYKIKELHEIYPVECTGLIKIVQDANEKCAKDVYKVLDFISLLPESLAEFIMEVACANLRRAALYIEKQYKILIEEKKKAKEKAK